MKKYEKAFEAKKESMPGSMIGPRINLQYVSHFKVPVRLSCPSSAPSFRSFQSRNTVLVYFSIRYQQVA